jgi:exonuclease-1
MFSVTRSHAGIGNQPSVLRYFESRASRLRESGIKPLFVFDGDKVPAKKRTGFARSQARNTAMCRAVGLRDTGERELVPHFAKAADVNHEMVHTLVKFLQAQGYDAHVAPYEADAQLSFLARCGEIDCAISEDSDLIVYGCPRVIFKFDPLRGNGFEVSTRLSDVPIFKGLSEDAAVFACVLAGCDYGPNIHGIGIKRARLYAQEFDKSDDIEASILGACSLLSQRGYGSSGGVNTITDDVRTAIRVFSHQPVYDPRLHQMVPVRRAPHSYSGAIIPFDGQVGSMYAPQLAKGVYFGDLHPVTRLEYKNAVSTESPGYERVICGAAVNSFTYLGRYSTEVGLIP